MYDTFGFPFDLTKIICAEKGIHLKEEDFNIIKESMKSKRKEEKEDYIDHKGIERLKKLKIQMTK